MFNTFNMGIGFVLLVPPEQAQQIRHWFDAEGITAYVIGRVIEGNGSILGIPQESIS
ncbi:MAG: hypothetical protein F6J92_00300 [Symploca sp. SIO1A3]|nr:hypothetical protein [Symploca sp. SIO1A3]